jgi:TolA-binding protein
MANMTDYPENLLVRARRAALLPGESTELEHLLAASPTLRTAYRLGRDFDEIAAVEAGDEQRVERFVNRALATREPRKVRVFRSIQVSPWLAAAAVLAVCGVALGVRGVWLPKSSPSAISAPSVSAPVPVRRKFRPVPGSRELSQPLGESSAATTPSNQNVIVTRNIESKAPTALSASHAPQSVLPPAPVNRLASPIASAPTIASVNSNAVGQRNSLATLPVDEPIESDASALLRQANRARSLGEVERAILLFTQLHDKFPASAQAHVSLVSLGKLLMQRSMPEAALQRFSSYLVTPGPLEEEALFGRAQALGALGRTGDEIRTWERLLSRFPGSVYAGAAHKRLDALVGTSVK